MDLIVFLSQAVVISFSGVMAPGPVTAVTLGLGARNRHAGALVAIGHGIVEFPLMVLIILGIGGMFEIPAVRIGIGLAGGAMLIAMSVSMLMQVRKPAPSQSAPAIRGPVLTGILLSIGNPYFLLWWATVGLALASQAVSLGLIAFVFFAVLHWLCDLVWLEALSAASYRGSRIIGGASRRIVMAICAAALFFFGLVFLFKGARRLIGAATESA
ncbi:MAG: LysE family transporter [Planctomycetota bacterium]|nr:LysE family transporter [Planctomycetota bacterium]